MSSSASSLRSDRSGSSRNPRRRTRQETDEAGSLRQQPQRKRSKLNKETFPSSAETIPNGTATASTNTANGHVSPEHSDSSPSAAAAAAVEIPLRSKQHSASARRGVKGYDGTTLTQNDRYQVKQLPSLPAEIRSNTGVPFRGARIHSSGYALALTQNQALVWDYTIPVSQPSTRTLELSHPSKNDDPLPLGTFVTNGSAGEIGLVVINPTNGKISFWENLENADALSLFEQRRNGIEGSCGNLLSGEIVVDIEDAEPAGFVLSFSSGRTAQLLLRDMQSRPNVSVTFFRSQKGPSGGGFFSGLKNVFSGSSWLRNIAAVRCRPARSRGQTDVIISNEDALFQTWQLSWSGQPTLRSEVDARLSIEAAINPASADRATQQDKVVKVVDFAVAFEPGEQCSLTALVNIADPDTAYWLVHLTIEDDTVAVGNTIRIHSYSAPTILQANWKPKLCLQNSGVTAFVVFERAISVVSLRGTSSKGNPQLLSNSGKKIEHFQDTIGFRDGSELYTCGAASDPTTEKHQNSAAIVFVNKFGALRMVAHDSPSEVNRSVGTKLSAKSTIEQAVFFGSKPTNPLDLARKPLQEFPTDEIEEAALAVSDEILDTESPFITPVAPSMETHLESRARNLRDLALQVKRVHPGISRVARWELRWAAEKMAAARSVWTICENQPTKTRESRGRLLTLLLDYLNEKFKTAIDPDHGEQNQKRHFFFKDISRMGYVLQWPHHAVSLHRREGEIRDSVSFLKFLRSADEIVITGLQTAFAFRIQNAELYGLENEHVESDLLVDNYEGLPVFWTSPGDLVLGTQDHVKIAQLCIIDNTQELETVDDASDILKKLITDNHLLVDLYCKISEERRRWQRVNKEEIPDPALDDALKDTAEEQRKMLCGLPAISSDMTEQALHLAEKYNDLYSLVDVIVQQSGFWASFINSSNTTVANEASTNVEFLENKIRRYLEKYGEAFADVMYSELIAKRKWNSLLEQREQYKSELTRYLRADGTRSKLSWINDVISEKDYTHAGQTLLDVAKKQESSLWNKKVELSIAKLAFLAVDNADDSRNQIDGAKAAEYNEMQLVKIQEKLYDHIKPSVYSAVDQIAEVQLAMQSFGRRASERTPALQQLLERGLESLVKHAAMNPEQTMDVLTLMDQRRCEMPQYNICGRETILALQTLEHSGFRKDREKFELLSKIIWRRCFVRDDWEAINANAAGSDEAAVRNLESTALFKTLYEGQAQGIWEGQSAIPILPPTVVLHAGTDPADHSSRFQSADLCAPIAKDMTTEDEMLRRYLDKCQLEHWLTATKDLAEARLKEEAESKEGLVKKLGGVVGAAYEDDADLKRAAGQSDLSVPGNWEDAVQMGLGS